MIIEEYVENKSYESVFNSFVLKEMLLIDNASILIFNNILGHS